MYTVLSFCIVGFLLAYFITEEIDVAVLIGIISACVGLLVATIVVPAETTTCKNTLKIVNLQDGNSLNGRFYLGSGYVGSSMKYSFYYEQSDGNYKLMQIDADLTTIKISDTPQITSYVKCYTDSRINDWVIKINYHTYYIIEVPKGSIKENFNLDAQ